MAAALGVGARRRVHRGALAAAVVIGAGIAFRLWLAAGPLGHPSSDESVVGLMAMELFRHGHLGAFYWGQSYGGSLEAVLVAPGLWLFGPSAVALKGVSLLAGLAASVLTWRIARHLFRPAVAAGAGLVSLFWPATLVWYGTKEGGFYPVTAALGLLVVLIALQIDADPARPSRWMALGLAAGVGWWMSPNIAYYAIPMAAWLVARGHWRRPRDVAIAAGAFVTGSAVWIGANLLSGFDSLHAPAGWAGSSTYVSRFEFFWRSGLPFAMGLRQPFGPRWYGGRYVAAGLYVLVLGGLALAFATGARSRPARLFVPDLFLLAAAPFVYAAFVGNWRLFEGRYTYFVASMMPILIGRILQTHVGVALVAVLVVVPGIAFLRDYDHNRSTIGPTAVPIARALEQAGYRTAVGDYAIAYQLTFESDERVIAVPTANDRYPPFRRQVRRATPAYVFYASDTASARDLERTLRVRRVQYRTITAGRYLAVLPSVRYVSPALAGPG